MNCTVPACDCTDTRLFQVGCRCVAHSPAAQAGRVVPVPDPALTLAALQAAGRPAYPQHEYGQAPTGAVPHWRKGDDKAHLVTDGAALCARPAGREGWRRCDEAPEVKARCRDCSRVMVASNPKPYDLRHWWHS